jgi:hypothetical protein
VKPGDVVVIPAAWGHKRMESSLDFSVIGAYPGGRVWLLSGFPGERPRADRNIAAVPLPDNHPIAGRMEGWKGGRMRGSAFFQIISATPRPPCPPCEFFSCCPRRGQNFNSAAVIRTSFRNAWSRTMVRWMD